MKCQAGWITSCNQDCWENIKNLRNTSDITLMAESEEELKSVLIRVKTRMKSWIETQHSKNEDYGIWSHYFTANRRGERGSMTDYLFLSSNITADGDSSQRIKRHLCLGRKALTNLDSLLKSRDINLPTSSIQSKYGFPVVIYGCESCTVKKAECQRTDAFVFCFFHLFLLVGG